MTSDLIDRAFLHRLGAWGDVRPAASADPCSMERGSSAVAEHGDPVVGALLERCPEQWAQLADRIEAAWGRGDRVVAVVGRAKGDGCSTVVAGLVHVLRGRGRVVTCHDGAAIRAGDEVHEGDGPVIVDAGVWFPPGPLRRSRLELAAVGCQAAVLVRRATRASSPGHVAVLEGIGVKVLGEVVTFDDREPDAADSGHAR